MTFDFICHGSGEAMYQVFNAIATFFNGSGESKSGFGMMVYSATTIGMAAIGAQLAVKLDMLSSLKKIVGLFLVVTMINNISANVRIVDKITNDNTKVVANVPYVLASLAALSSQLGNFMAEKFDSLFSLPDGGKYTESGLVMSSKFIDRASKMQIIDPKHNQNMKQFVSQCVILNGISKGKFTLKDINEATNLWELLKNKVSPRFGFKYNNEGFLSCRDIAEKLDANWGDIIKKAYKSYEISSLDGAVRNEVSSNIASSYEFLTQISQDAAVIMKQNIMQNMLKEGAIHGLSEYDPEAAMQAYSIARAKSTQESSMKVIGAIGASFLTPLKIVIEALFYGIFPIVAIMVILPGGLKVAKTYAVALFWIQSWAPLYAILNMVMTVYGKSTSIGILKSFDVTNGLSIQAVGALGDANSAVVAAASSAVPYIPMLSYLIFKSGAGALTQLSTSMMMQANASAGSAADEAVTGRISLATTSFNSHQMHNMSGFKHDTNAMVRDGGFSYQGSSGEMVSHYGENTVYDMNPAISNIGGDVKLGKSIASSISKQADESHREALTEAVSSQKSMAATLNQLESFNEARTNSFSHDNSASHTDSWGEDQSIAKLNSLNTRLAEHLGVDERTAKEFAAAAAVTYGTPGITKGIFGAGLDGRLSGSVGDSQHYSEMISKTKDFYEGREL